MNEVLFALGLIASIELVVARNPSENITRVTKLGQINGVKQFSNSNKSTEIFLGIPYAKSPTGHLRFAKPVEYGKWNETWNATAFGPACMQPRSRMRYGMSENCLHLNVYSPVTDNAQGNRSVMVWIHGGAYITGTSSSYDGSKLAEVGDVVVVTLNYRLGIFGFISYNDSLAKGNYGLWDQIMALEWVKDNIDDYGGNPNDITVFGESAGGFSVGLLTLISSNRGLFHRAIAESGVANSLFAIGKTRPLHVSIGTGNIAGCMYNQTDIEDTLNCMRRISAVELLKATKEFSKTSDNSSHIAILFSPVIDNELFKVHPAELLSDRSSEAFTFFQSLDVIIGNCDMEGSLFLGIKQSAQKVNGFKIADGIPNSYFCKTLIPTLSNDYFSNNNAVSTAICNEYGVMDNLAEQSREVLNMFTDLFFISPAVSTLSSHIAGNTNTKAYQYVFSQKNPYEKSRPTWYEGSGHASELNYIFFLEEKEKSNKHVKLTIEDQNLALQMRKYWTNFAKTGNPNSNDLPTWPTYTATKPVYLQINEKNMTTGTHYKQKRMNFWLKTVPFLMESTNTFTHAPSTNTAVDLFPIVRIYNLLFILGVLILV